MFIPVSITPKAAEEVKNILEKKNIPEGYGLRIGVRGAGCGGMSYVLGFDKKKEADEQYTIEDIPVYVEKKHVMYLAGLEVDFYEGSDARGFLFTDPKKKAAEEATS
ncbi:HesB/IscA family protein [Roseivirga sp. BDSF3-8]|uniref:HesB/IscA family protein n=1 Tax=Roseivirga sp. BDSF3-8 TaxID=3241598 RepID=UPI003532158E